MSNYMNERRVADTTATSKRPRWAAVLSTLFALAVAFTMLVPLWAIAHNTTDGTLAQPVQAQAFAPILCGADIGVGMDEKRRPSDALMTSYTNIDAANRKWTLQEAYGGGMNVVSFQGFGSGSWVTTKELADDTYTPENMDAVMAQFEEMRTPYTCTLGAGAAFVSTLQIKVAGMLTSFTNSVVGAAVGTNLFCSEAGQDGCFDMLGIVGGDSNSDETSLISILGRSIYTPLILFAVVAAAVSIAYQGIVKRRFRDAFGKVLWVVGSAVLGMILLLMPYNLTQAPTILANSITSCLIGAFNGQNCMTGETTNEGMSIGGDDSAYADICSVGADGASTTEQFDFMVETLGCSIWAAFVLEPYSKASFGVTFVELTTTVADNVELQQAITDAGLEPEAFCINLTSSGSAADNVNTRVDMDGGGRGDSGTVCNLAAYQMFLAHDTTPASAHLAGGVAPDSGDTDDRWYNVATVVAHSDGLWDTWKSSTVSDFNKLNMGLTSVLSSIVGSVLLLVVSFYALIYKVGGMFLIALAPLFLLFMIEPTRGRKIAAGYLGQLLSTVFKYLASGLFLLVSLLAFGTLLASMNGLYQVNVLLMVILSGALLMYRAQVVELLGRVNMGTTVFTDKITDRVKGTASMMGQTTMGGIGSKAGGGSFSEGAAKALKQEVASGRGKQAFGDGVGGALQSGVLTAGAVQRTKQGINAYQQKKKAGGANAPQRTHAGGAPKQTGSGTQQQTGSSTGSANAPQQGGSGTAGSSSAPRSGGTPPANAPLQGSSAPHKKVKMNVKPQAGGTQSPRSGIPVNVNAPKLPGETNEPVNVKLNVETQITDSRTPPSSATQHGAPANTPQQGDSAPQQRTGALQTHTGGGAQQARFTGGSTRREEPRIGSTPRVNAPQQGGGGSTHTQVNVSKKPDARGTREEPRIVGKPPVNAPPHDAPQSTDTAKPQAGGSAPPREEPRTVDIPQELKEQARSAGRGIPREEPRIVGKPPVNAPPHDAQQSTDTAKTHAGRSAPPREEPRIVDIPQELNERPRSTDSSTTGKTPPRVVGIPTKRPDEAKHLPKKPREQPPEQ